MMPQQIDAGIIRGMAELIVEAAKLAMPVAAEASEATLVARVVDVGGHFGGTLGVTRGRRWRAGPRR
jgi:hypothetical protein